MLGKLSTPAALRGQTGKPGSHGLQQRVPECFGSGREDEEVGGGVGLGQPLLVHKTEHMNAGHLPPPDLSSSGPRPTRAS